MYYSGECRYSVELIWHMEKEHRKTIFTPRNHLEMFHVDMMCLIKAFGKYCGTDNFAIFVQITESSSVTRAVTRVQHKLFWAVSVICHVDDEATLNKRVFSVSPSFLSWGSVLTNDSKVKKLLHYLTLFKKAWEQWLPLRHLEHNIWLLHSTFGITVSRVMKIDSS